MIRNPSSFISVVLTTTVICFCGLSLLLGWGAGVDGLVRVNPNANAIIPATSLCLMMIAISNLPFARIVKLRKAMNVLGIVSVALFALSLDGPINALFDSQPSPHDGLSNATIIGVVLLAIAPAIRLGLLRLNGEWTFHIPLFGLMLGAVSIFVITFDAYYFDNIQPFTNLSHYTAIALTVMFAAQLMVHEEPQDDLDRELT